MRDSQTVRDTFSEHNIDKPSGGIKWLAEDNVVERPAGSFRLAIRRSRDAR